MPKLAALLVDPHDPAEFIISEAEGSNIVHTGIILDDGAMVFADCRSGVVCKMLDTSDVTRWLVIDLPWAMNPDCEAWWKSTIGAKYNLLGCIFSAIRGTGISEAGEYFCSQHSAELISRLTGGPQGIPPLCCPAKLVQTVLGKISPYAVNTPAFRPQNCRPAFDFLKGLMQPARKVESQAVGSLFAPDGLSDLIAKATAFLDSLPQSKANFDALIAESRTLVAKLSAAADGIPALLQLIGKTAADGDDLIESIWKKIGTISKALST